MVLPIMFQASILPIEDRIAGVFFTVVHYWNWATMLEAHMAGIVSLAVLSMEFNTTNRASRGQFVFRIRIFGDPNRENSTILYTIIKISDLPVTAELHLNLLGWR